MSTFRLYFPQIALLPLALSIGCGRPLAQMPVESLNVDVSPGFEDVDPSVGVYLDTPSDQPIDNCAVLAGATVEIDGASDFVLLDDGSSKLFSSGCRGVFFTGRTSSSADQRETSIRIFDDSHSISATAINFYVPHDAQFAGIAGAAGEEVYVVTYTPVTDEILFGDEFQTRSKAALVWTTPSGATEEYDLSAGGHARVRVSEGRFEIPADLIPQDATNVSFSYMSQSKVESCEGVPTCRFNFNSGRKVQLTDATN